MAAGSATANLAVSASKRTAYVSRLRRAFLLRAHPDRFRSCSGSLRKGQAELIQALSERLVASDFITYTSSGITNTKSTLLQNQTSWKKTYKYYLETKDGSLSQFTLHLDDNVENVLTSMCKALQSTGLSNYPLPPPPTPPQPQHPEGQNSYEFMNRFSKDNSNNWNEHQFNQNTSSRFHESLSSFGGSNRSFDVNTTKGRGLMSFLASLDFTDIEKRKSERLDASAAALVARQAYKFQAVDGTSLGWSSKSLAQCLNGLTNLFDEHNSKFKVNSFYPLRLLMTNDEYRNKLDLFGGTIRLNPMDTPSQWLATLMSVTEESLEELKENRRKLNKYISHVQDSLNVQMKKGYSCSSKEYHLLLHTLSSVIDQHHNDESAKNIKIPPNALAMDRMTIVIETDQACRNPLLTREGHLRVSAGMPMSTIISAVSNLRREATQKIVEEAEKDRKSKELIAIVKLKLGLSQVKRQNVSIITSDQLLVCIETLLSMDEAVKDILREYLLGQKLGIAGRGRSCHLGDDGAIIIPWDCSFSQ